MQISDLNITDSHAILTQEQFDEIQTCQQNPEPEAGVMWKRIINLSPELWSLFWYEEDKILHLPFSKIRGNYRHIKIKSKNANCLVDFRCPNCGQEDAFKLEAKVMVYLTDQGTENLNEGCDWDYDYFCHCPVCDHDGIVRDFSIEHQEELLLSSNNVGEGI